LTVLATAIVSVARRVIKKRAAAAARLAQEPTTPAEIADAKARRQRLLASLRECGVDRAPPSLLRWLSSVAVLFGLGIVFVFGSAIVDQAHGPDRLFIRIVWLLFVTFVLGKFSITP
jgi:hypothetical protein